VVRYQDGIPRATTIFEAAAWHYAIRVTCRACNHAATFHPHALWWLFERKGWDGQLRQAGARFRCETCRAKRGARLELTRDEPTVQLPLPAEHEWKRAVSRFRS